MSQAFFCAAGGCSEMSVCFPLATKLPEMHPFSDIQYSLVAQYRDSKNFLGEIIT